MRVICLLKTPTANALKVTVISPVSPFKTGVEEYFGTVQPHPASTFEMISGSSPRFLNLKIVVTGTFCFIFYKLRAFHKKNFLWRPG